MLGDPTLALASPYERTASILLPPHVHPCGRRAARVAAAEIREVGAMVFDSLGCPVFSNGALRRLLAQEPDASKVIDTLEKWGRELCRAARRVTAADDAAIPRGASRLVLTASARYRLLPVVVGSDTTRGLPFLAVLVERIALHDEGWRQIRPSAQLTPREVQVAHLLCIGRSNTEIAMTICISLSTARRHVEHVFAKLGVHRRGEVLVQLLSEGRSSWQGTRVFE